jgi:hypothetical protein
MADTTTAQPRTFSRWQASGIHLLISAAIASASLFLMLRVWYPPPLFTAEGGNDILFILIGVDVVIGPLITLVIFKSGKPGLRFDLTVIGVLQACALAYGIHVMFVARPVYIALMDDQFETVRANDLDPGNVARAARPEFKSIPLTGPQYIAVELPRDAKVLRELISQAVSGGEVLQHLPQYYVPYSEVKAKALAKSQPLQSLRGADPGVAARIDREISDTGRNASDLNFLRLETRRGWGAVLIDAKTGDIAKILPPGVLF